MKTYSDSLYRLIKSLNSQEKRFFKLFARQNQKGTIYLKLFDALDGLNTYDEKKLLQVLNKTGGIKSLKQFKSYLQEAILIFLEYHHAGYSVEIQLQRLLQRIELLFEKQLFNQAKKTIQKAEKLADANHQYLNLLKILDWKRKIMIKELDFTAFREYQQKHYASELHCITLYSNNLEYQKINVQVMEFMVIRGDYIDERIIVKLNEILNIPLLKDEQLALSFPSKIIFCNILGNIHLLLKNWEKCLRYFYRATEYFEQAKLSPKDRLIIYSRLTVALRAQNKSDELTLIKNDASKLIRSLPEKLKTINIFSSYFSLMNNYIYYQLSIFNTDEALLASEEIDELANKYASTQSLMVYYCHLFLLSFLRSDYHKALSYVNLVLSFEKTGIRQDIIFFIKIINLVVHYELGNEDMLRNLCKSYANDFDKQLVQNKSEKLLLNFFGKTIHEKIYQQNRKKYFLKLKTELELYKNEKIHLEFDFLSWVESTIENKSFEKVLRRKHLTKN